MSLKSANVLNGLVALEYKMTYLHAVAYIAYSVINYAWYLVKFFSF